MILRRTIAYILLSVSVSCIGCSPVQQKAGQPARLAEPRLMPLGESEWNQAQAKALIPLKRYFKDGQVINILTTVARHPALLESWLTFGHHVLQASSIPARDREILILRIGWLCRSEYEFGQHTVVGKEVGLSDEEILRITKGPEATGWSAFDAALIRASDELHENAFISDETWKVLASKYDERQLLDVIFTVGQYNLVSMVLNSCGVQREPGVPGFPEGAEF